MLNILRVSALFFSSALVTAAVHDHNNGAASPIMQLSLYPNSAIKHCTSKELILGLYDEKKMVAYDLETKQSKVLLAEYFRTATPINDDLLAFGKKHKIVLFSRSLNKAIKNHGVPIRHDNCQINQLFWNKEHSSLILLTDRDIQVLHLALQGQHNVELTRSKSIKISGIIMGATLGDDGLIFSLNKKKNRAACVKKLDLTNLAVHELVEATGYDMHFSNNILSGVCDSDISESLFFRYDVNDEKWRHVIGLQDEDTHEPLPVFLCEVIEDKYVVLTTISKNLPIVDFKTQNVVEDIWDKLENLQDPKPKPFKYDPYKKTFAVEQLKYLPETKKLVMRLTHGAVVFYDCAHLVEK